MKKKIISVALMFALLLSVVPMLNVDVASAKKMPTPKVTYTNTGLMKFIRCSTKLENTINLEPFRLDTT